MQKYVKKPIVIEAIQYTVKNSADIHEFAGKCVSEPIKGDHLLIHTLEGRHVASPGDYIIKGIKGEFYPCKPDIFEKTYENHKSGVLGMDFCNATECAKVGHKIARHGWNSKGMFVIYQPESNVPVKDIRNATLSRYYADPGLEVMKINPHFMIKNTDESISTWVPSINDSLAIDWYIVE